MVVFSSSTGTSILAVDYMPFHGLLLLLRVFAVFLDYLAKTSKLLTFFPTILAGNFSAVHFSSNYYSNWIGFFTVTLSIFVLMLTVLVRTVCIVASEVFLIACCSDFV